MFGTATVDDFVNNSNQTELPPMNEKSGDTSSDSEEFLLRLPADLCRAAEQYIKDTKFSNLPEFLTFVLRELIASDSSQADERERKMIEQRLRDLGYL